MSQDSRNDHGEGMPSSHPSTGAPATWLADGWRTVSHWLLPQSCAGCGSPPEAVCAAGRAQLEPHLTLVERRQHQLTIRSAIGYAGPVRGMMRDLKTHGSLHCARALAPAVRLLAESDAQLRNADVIITPPSRPEAYRKRGFHPVRLLTEASGLATVQPFTMRSGRADQRRLSAPERAQNLVGAFQLRRRWERQLSGAHVILFDDVVTTGSTLAELRSACTQAGAEVVSIWALCHTEWRQPARGSAQA